MHASQRLQQTRNHFVKLKCILMPRGWPYPETYPGVGDKADVGDPTHVLLIALRTGHPREK
eukprot:scaffold263256_cov17-Prasinocladus_malaysianus.AAC.1